MHFCVCICYWYEDTPSEFAVSDFFSFLYSITMVVKLSIWCQVITRTILLYDMLGIHG